MTRFAIYTSILLAAGSFVLGYARAGLWLLVIISIILAILLWTYFQWRDVRWSSTAILGLAVLAGAVGIYYGVNPGWMLAGVSFSLFAWDMMGFQNRLKLAAEESAVFALEKSHLLHLVIVASVEVILYLITVFVHLKLGLWLLIALAFITALGLAQMVWRLHPR